MHQKVHADGFSKLCAEIVQTQSFNGFAVETMDGSGLVVKSEVQQG